MSITFAQAFLHTYILIEDTIHNTSELPLYTFSKSTSCGFAQVPLEW